VLQETTVSCNVGHDFELKLIIERFRAANILLCGTPAVHVDLMLERVHD